MSAMCCQAANAVKEVSIMGDDHHGMGILLWKVVVQPQNLNATSLQYQAVVKFWGLLLSSDIEETIYIEILRGKLHLDPNG